MWGHLLNHWRSLLGSCYWEDQTRRQENIIKKISGGGRTGIRRARFEKEVKMKEEVMIRELKIGVLATTSIVFTRSTYSNIYLDQCILSIDETSHRWVRRARRQGAVYDDSVTLYDYPTQNQPTDDPSVTHRRPGNDVPTETWKLQLRLSPT